MFEFIVYLKSLATILITNSHFDRIYPVAALSIGGSIGNSLFFWASGYCLANINEEKGVLGGCSWYAHRLWRIYVPCVVAVLINTVYRYVIGVATPNVMEIVGNILNPTVGIWFVQAILILYIFYYFTIVAIKKEWVGYRQVFILIGMIYIISYIFCVDKSYISIENNGLFKWAYYFIIMIMGSCCRMKKRKKNLNNGLVALFCCFLLIFFYLIQFIIKIFPVLLPIQIIIHIEEMIFIYSLTYLFENLETIFVKIKSVSVVSNVANALAKVTLEIYLVQMVVINLCANYLTFPISFVCAVVGIYLYAAGVDYIAKRLRTWIEHNIFWKGK